MSNKEDTNDLRAEISDSALEAEKAAKEIFAPLSKDLNLTNKEDIYKSLDSLLATNSEFKSKYDNIMNDIVANVLYKKLLETYSEEEPEEEQLAKAAAKI